MSMLTELKFTDARKDFSSLYNQVYNAFKPAVIKRNQKEELMILRTDLQKLLLTNFSLKPEILHEEDDSVTLALDQLEVYANGETLEHAIKNLIEDLKVYASDYLERSQLFLNAPNRRPHFPYILRILLAENDQEIHEMLEL